MQPSIIRYCLAGWALSTLLAASLGAASSSPDDAAGIEFFEQKIRPVLVDACFNCHSHQSEKVKGGLLLDTRDGLLKGGDSGAAVIPGNIEKSLLLSAVRYTNEDLKMPPPPKGKKLPAEQVANLEKWVAMGAPFPAAAAPQTSGGGITQRAQTHWAFRPILAPAPPPVKNERWISTPVDAFILSKLEQLRLQPNPMADRRTLIRRATFDLTGLPPAAADVQAFVEDRSEDAFAKVIDRLLASPAYGEKWGRHWLDVARYADTKGYVFEEERRYPFAYTYRDYVIRALNEDLPYDQFLVQQIAADLLDLGEDKRPLAALGFLTLGRRFLNNTADIIDDRIDVVTRGTMALTVTCARCHDHKYDPIPTRDYYSLYGVFASSFEPKDPPVLTSTEFPPKYPEYVKEREKRTAEVKQYRQEKEREFLGKAREQTGEYLLAVFELQSDTDREKRDSLIRKRKLDPGLAERWDKYLKEQSWTNHPIFAPWAWIKESEGNEGGPANTNALDAFFQTASSNANPIILAELKRSPPDSRRKLADAYNQIFSNVVRQVRQTNSPPPTGDQEGPGPGRVESPDSHPPGFAALEQVLFADGSPYNLASGQIERLFDIPARQKVRALQRRVDELDATHPGTPPRGMVLRENSSPYNPRVFVRGNPNNPGAEVPRQFLEAIAGEQRRPFSNGSGRLELARAIASDDNPLTARVIVNRIWLHHFGKGLVRTPSDFGLRSEPPTHPELLDYLAASLIQGGWSLKKLHRLIMLSSVYQESSEDNPRYAQIDPANQYLWKWNRHRLEFEELRDALLAVSGSLDGTAGGRPVEITAPPYSNRRTVYGFIERQNLPGVFRTFDFASPDTTSPQRFYTTVPQQALYLMNSPFLIEQARKLVSRAKSVRGATPDDTIKFLYRAVYQRPPRPDEFKMAVEFINRSLPPSKALHPPVWEYGTGVYLESECRTDFQPLPAFAGDAWQGGEDLPDPKLGWVMLNAGGGHPGDRAHAAIRRWRAPRDGQVTISGSLNHETDKGDGVVGRIVSSRDGEVGKWVVKNKKEKTSIEDLEVKTGDTIDFVVESGENVDSDGFNWAPIIKMGETGGTLPAWDDPGTEWSAKADFSGTQEAIRPLNVWEKYAQVLLLSNELTFVD